MLHSLNEDILVDNFIDTVEKTIEKVFEITDPVAKETRTFGVHAYPELIKLIVSLQPPGSFGTHLDYSYENYLQQPCVKDFNLLVGFEDYSDHDYDMGNLILDPIIKSMKFWKRKVSPSFIVIKTSNRTLIGNIPISKRIASLVKLLTIDKVVPDFRDIILSNCPTLYESMFQSYIDKQTLHPILQNFLTILMTSKSKEDIIIALRNVPKSLWNNQKLLKMHVKLYINRADRRAYYVDTMIIRHLAGSILQSYLLGPKMRVRESLLVSDWYPSKDKNVIDLTLTVGRNQHVLLLFGDLSSFTNNDLNAWVYCIAILQLLGKLDATELIAQYCVRGRLFSASLDDVVLAYLLTWVGSDSQLPDKSAYTSIGGYLGIKANIVLTIYSFVLRMIDLQNKFQSSNPLVRFHGQIGGDDFFVYLIGDNLNELIYLRQTIVATMERYFGRLKEPTQFEYNIDSVSGVARADFCKKKVVVFVNIDSNNYHTYDLVIRSVEKLPLMSQLITLVATDNNRDKLNELRKFYVQMKNFFKYSRESESLINIYMCAYFDAYGITGINTCRWKTKSISSDAIKLLDNHYVTNNAYMKLLIFDNLYTRDFRNLTSSFTEKLTILRLLEVIEVTRLYHYNTDSYILLNHTKEDTKLIHEHVHSINLDVMATDNSVRLCDSFRHLREQLKLLEDEVDDNDVHNDDDSVSVHTV